MGEAALKVKKLFILTPVKLHPPFPGWTERHWLSTADYQLCLPIFAQVAHLHSFHVSLPELLDQKGLGVTADVVMFQLTCLVTSLSPTSCSYITKDFSNPEGICGCLQKLMVYLLWQFQSIYKALLLSRASPRLLSPFLSWSKLKLFAQLHSSKKCKGRRKETKTLLRLPDIWSGMRFGKGRIWK